MKIRKMTAHFGALDGATLTLSDGLNILYAPNESGKSTWCAFLRAMLYGLSTSQRARAGQKPDRLKYRPWSGAPMSGSMDLATSDGPVTLRRWTESDNRPMQAFSAAVTGTDLPVRGLTGDSAGEVLTGMPAEVFERSVFIRQSGLEVTGDPELERRINAIVTSGDETVSFSETEKRLRSWLRHRRSGKRGAIPELQAELDDTRRTLDAIREHERAAEAAEEEVAALERRYAETEARMHAARAAQRKRALASLAEAHTAVRDAENACAQAGNELSRAEEALSASPFGTDGPEAAERRAQTDGERAAELQRLAEKKPSLLPVLLPPVLAVTAFVLALLLPWRAELAAAGCLFVLLFTAAYARLQSTRRRQTEALASRRRLLDGYGVDGAEAFPALLEDYNALWQACQAAQLRLETAQAALAAQKAAQRKTESEAMAALDFTGGDNEAARLGRELDGIRARIAELREKRAMTEGLARALGDPLSLESELAEGERRHTELLRQEEALSLALDALTWADEQLQQRLSPVLAKKAAEYFSALTDGRYDEVTLARDLTAQARLTGEDVGRELDYLSAGAKDQLYLALRLAVCDLALPGDDPCPIILDDALVTFDGERMALALRLMKRIAETRQVLIFTCHTREAEYFAKDRRVTRLTLK